MNKQIFKGKFLGGLIIAGVIVVGSFLGYKFFSNSQPQQVDKTTYVKAIKVAEATGDQLGSYPGVIKGRYETNLAFQVPGKIVKKLVNLGDEVVAGQVLMVLDQADLQDTYNSAKAQVSAAASQLELAQTTLARYRKLYAENAVSAQTLDQMEANYKAALANYNNAQAQASRSGNALNYTELKATKAGVISQVMGEVGQVVSAGQPVVQFVENGGYEVEIAVPENKLATVAVNKPVTVNLWTVSQEELSGHIREVAPMADPATRAYKVKVALDKMPAYGKLGMTAKVNIKGEENKGVVLPLAAIYQVGDKPQVWLITENKGVKTVHLQTVSVKGLDDDHVEVMNLDPDATVVVAGVNKLVENQRVEVLKGDK